MRTRMKHCHFHAYFSRVSCLHFEIVDTKFVAIVCYMPTSWDTDAAVEENYSLLDLLIPNAERTNAIPILEEISMQPLVRRRLEMICH